MRQTGDQGKQEHYAGCNIKRFGIIQELSGQFLAEAVFIGGTRHQDTGGGGDDQGRNLGHQSFADGQQGVVAQGIHQRHALLPDTDDQSSEDVDQHDHDAGNRVAADKLAGTVHRTVEICLARYFETTDLGLFVGQQSGREIGIDSHLFARHRIQGKSGRNFGDASGTLGDDDEVYDHQNQEENGTDNVIAADHELSEGLDDCTGRLGPFAAMQQYKAGGCNVECQAEEGRYQQHRRKN